MTANRRCQNSLEAVHALLVHFLWLYWLYRYTAGVPNILIEVRIVRTPELLLLSCAYGIIGIGLANRLWCLVEENLAGASTASTEESFETV